MKAGVLFLLGLLTGVILKSTVDLLALRSTRTPFAIVTSANGPAGSPVPGVTQRSYILKCADKQIALLMTENSFISELLIPVGLDGQRALFVSGREGRFPSSVTISVHQRGEEGQIESSETLEDHDLDGVPDIKELTGPMGMKRLQRTGDLHWTELTSTSRGDASSDVETGN